MNDLWRAELGPTMRLAGPVILAELGWVAMGTVDTMIVGRLGAEAIGAVSLGSMLFFTVVVFGIGLLLGLDTLVAHAFGAGDRAECRRWLVQGRILALALTPPLTLLVIAALPALGHLGLHPTVLRLAGPYLKATLWSLGPLLVFAALRRYTQAVGRTAPIVVALVGANLVNVVANWALVFGHLGAPALGVEGSGWATTLARTFMMLVLIVDLLFQEGGRTSGFLRISWRPDPGRLARLLRLGVPASGQVTLELAVFALATTLIGRLDPISLAAHQVVLSIICVTYMIPLGLAAAAAIRVGQALGRRDPRGAARAGWMAIALGGGFMVAAGLTLLLAPRTLLALFTDDPSIVPIGLKLLAIAAGFQLFDGLQVVTIGALRGAGDTRTPMLCNILAYWILGLPVGTALAYPAGLGAVGLWVGLSTGIIIAGAILVRVWTLKAQALE